MNRKTFNQYLYGSLLLMGCLVAACGEEDTPIIPSTNPEEFAATVIYVTVDPSGYCPLAAEIRINTEGGTAIRATVLPKPDAITPAQEHLFPYSNGAAQFIHVFGLYADYTNQVKLTYLNEQGVVQGDTLLEVKVGPLDFANVVPKVFRVLEADTSRMEPGMNLMIYTPNGDNDTSMPYMVDADGEIRYIINWRNSEEMLHTTVNAAFSRMKDGNWLLGDRNQGYIRTVNMLGEVVKTYDFATTDGYKFHHDVQEMKNGNLISCMSQDDAVRVDGTSRIRDQIIEWNPVSETIVHQWDLVNMLDSARFGAKVLGVNPAAMSSQNWAHNNAVSDWGENYLASSRYQGIFKYKPSGELMWVLAPHRGWREQYQQHLLTPLDHEGNPITNPSVIEGAAYTDDFDWVWGPHAPVALPDENTGDNLQRILVFDNGLARNFIRNNQQIPYSRAVIYEIDEENMTVRQVWDFGKGDPRYYASDRSNAGYLPQTGHVLFCPSEGVALSNGKSGSCIIEIDPATNETIYHLELENAGGFHRVYRLPLYAE